MEKPQHLRSSVFIKYSWMKRQSFCIELVKEEGLLETDKQEAELLDTDR